ncbi:ABC-type multidrug transport system ATPase subunit [Paenibacillus phyllosphaerae]|uniref:ABC-type multidrug transport system ATPase subunit n=1 Tax=Paenibacillus phyllosphaerae TaxID=274593 RepID=A0A7W5B507_9BACL|nr:ABC transporter ATP-binding protein [Paenibacillus phyllosphaerae]MBB3114377.1 ABC-type multidrug transport system ATPase subunit [Paenibacillus phyllosphaerae]
MIELHQVLFRHNGSDFELYVPSLRLKPGITLLVGRNGAGKSSLLQLLATAKFPDSGDIRFGGLTAPSDLPSIRSRIGFVPSGVELYEQMTPVKLLRYFGELKGIVDHDEQERLLEAFRLNRCREARIKTLPQGVKQRLALAQAWIASPTFLFFDEPLNALDTLERAHFTRFTAANSSNRTIIVSTHEMNEWAAWADHVLWFDAGRPRFYGTANAWTEELPLRVWTGFVREGTYRELDPGKLLHVRPDAGGFHVRLIDEHPPGAEFELAATTLEDAYFIRCRT